MVVFDFDPVDFDVDVRRCVAVEVVALEDCGCFAEVAVFLAVDLRLADLLLEVEDFFCAVEGSCASTPRLASVASAKATIRIRK